MKKLILFALSLVLVTSCFAQRDIKTLDSRTPEEIIAIFGKPDVEDFSMNEYMDGVVFYQDKHFFFDLVQINDSGDEAFLCGSIETCDPSLCVFTDRIDGGIKIGDPLSKLQLLGDVLQPNEMPYDIFSHPANYVAFKDECESYFFSVENGVVTAFSVLEKDDCTE